MKLYVLDNGYEKLDKSFFVAGANCGYMSAPNPDHVWIDIPIQAFLIEHEAGYILYDTGCDPDFKKNWPDFIEEQSPYYVTGEQQLLNRLGALGVKPEDIKYVVMSHLHVDHAGNLHRFQNAQVMVNETELTETLKAYATGRDMDVHVPSDVEHFLAAKLNWMLLPHEVREYELVPGVTLLNLGSGHSFGMVAVKVELPNTGNLLLVQDAIYFEENVKPEIQPPGILYDSLGYKRTARYLLDYARRHNCTIWYGHDMAQYRTLVKSHEGFYD